MTEKKLRLSAPMSLEQLEEIYKKSVLSQEFYNADYANEWKKSSEPFNVMSQYIQDILKPKKVLDVGCGIGILTKELLDNGIEAEGLEYSDSFINMSPIKKHLHKGDITDLSRFKDGSFDVVVAMEVLEHVPPTYLTSIISELRRITKRFILATIPSFGPNDHGYSGLPINEEYWLRDAKENIPFRNIVVDEGSIPDCGHITLATYRWWTEKFLKESLIRQPNLENIGYEKYNFLKYRWNLYLLQGLSNERVYNNGTDDLEGGYYEAEKWATGPQIRGMGDTKEVRWTKRMAEIFINKIQERPIKIKFFSGPKELIYDRQLQISVYKLTEDKDLKLEFIELTTQTNTIEPDRWYSITVQGTSSHTGILKVNIHLDKTFTPNSLLINQDKRELGIAIHKIG
jgi:SAM-dependent methyltransferase